MCGYLQYLLKTVISINMNNYVQINLNIFIAKFQKKLRAIQN
jgi:hypothetical protein